jgi:hypothetical protein
MQNVTFVYKSPNSTKSLNYHVSKLLAPGIYHGMDIVPTLPPSMGTDLTAGYAFTDEGIKIEETLPIHPVVVFDAADPNFPRVDLVVLRHRYDPTRNPNAATYVIIKGAPTPPPATATPKLTVETDPVAIEWPVSLHPGDIIIADVLIPAGCLAITDDLIFNRLRTLTTPELQAQIARALFIGLGNFVYEGWEFSSDVLNLIVSPGEGLLCGLPNHTTINTIITTLRAREYLYGPLDMDTHTHLYPAGENLTLERQPDYSSKLRITVTCTDTPTSGFIYVTGKNEYHEEINNEAIYVNCPSGASVTVETATKFSEVYHEGVDAHELIRAGHLVTVFISDKPIAYIYAMGTPSGRALFKAVYDPAYVPLCNEYLLGWVETDETHVINMTRWAVDSLSMVIENLSDQCDGVRKIFTFTGIPKHDSQIVVMDGMTLRPGSNKGYAIHNNIITLGSLLDAPDNPTHGQAPTDLWVMYKRQQ